MTLRNLVRREQTEDELRRLAAEVADWLALRRQRDPHRQYHSQLAAIEALITTSCARLTADLVARDTTQPSDAFFQQCYMMDLRVLWLRRVWQFFRQRFDQRDDPRLGPLLRAADEVVWSCYHQVFVRAEAHGLATSPGPAPLPFVEADYSPAAYPATLVPDTLRGAGFLRELLNRLPVPMVRLPPTCAQAPWWLVFVGHEVGHHIQYSLLAEAALVNQFRDYLAATVRAHHGHDEHLWAAWGIEIFADLFSILTMGPWALWGMVELELRPAAEMRIRTRGSYPAAVVRLALMAELLRLLGLDPQPALRGLDLPALAGDDEHIALDLALVPRIAPAALTALEQLPAVGVALRQLAGFRAEEFAPGGEVEAWADDLCGAGQRQPDTTLRGARLVTAGTLAGWARVAGLAESALRATRRAQLAERAIDMLARSREEGTRSAPPPRHVDALGIELGDLLLTLPDDDLVTPAEGL